MFYDTNSLNSASWLMTFLCNRSGKLELFIFHYSKISVWNETQIALDQHFALQILKTAGIKKIEEPKNTAVAFAPA